MALGLMTVLAMAGTSATAATSNPSHITPAATSNSSHMTPAAVDLYYQVVNYNSGKCLDVTGRSTANGAVLQQWTCLSGPTAANQGWFFISAASSGYYTVVNLNSNKCLDVTGRSTANGVHIQQWTCNGGTNQEWHPKVVGTYAAGDIYNFINLNSGKCLDVTGASTANGAIVEQWPCNGGNNQKWFEQIPS
jgi:glucosylceramidase